jgi:hypothetical protein
MHGCFVKEFTTSNFFKEATDIFGNEEYLPPIDDEGSVDEEGSIGVTVLKKKIRKVSFAGNERVTRGIKNVTQGAGVAMTVFTNLSKAEEDARIKKWKADIESKRKLLKLMKEKLEAQKKKVEEIKEAWARDAETKVRDPRWKEL